MNKDHQEVQVWLEKVFGGDLVPSYELNKKTVRILYKLMKLNEMKDKDTQIVIDDLRRKTDEYNVEARKLESILKSINLPIAGLSQSGVTSLRTLAKVALFLQTKDISESSYMLSIQHFHDELYNTSEELKLEERVIQALVEKTKMAIHNYNSLKKAAEDLNQQKSKQYPEMEKRAKESGFLHSKAKEYKEKVHQFQNELIKSKTDPSIYHGALVKTSEELQTLKDQLTPLKSKLQTYHSLPPDISLTKVKIEELKHELFPNVIELNVGGRHFSTGLLTLTKSKDTMLGAMFSGKYQVEKDQDGRYFIDADGDNFVYVLNYLRYGELPPPEVATTVYREAVYFGIHGMVEQLERYPAILAKIHRDSYRNQFTGYQKLINTILDKITEVSTKNKETTTSLIVALFSRDKKRILANFNKNHTCFYKSKNRTKRMCDITFGPWRNKSTSEKDVINCLSFDLQEKGFNITHESTGQCGYKCESPPENTREATVENCSRMCYTITFHWWKM